MQQLAGFERTGTAFGQLWRDAEQTLDVIAIVEATDENKRLAFGLFQRVLNLVRAIADVEVDEDGADFRGGKLRKHPFGAVRGPNSHAVAFLNADCHQGAGESFNSPMKASPSKPFKSVASDKSRPSRKRSGSAVEHCSNAKI